MKVTEKTASRCLRGKNRRNACNLDSCSCVSPASVDRAAWAEASWFYCLTVWFWLACEGGKKWLTSARLWKWAVSPAAGGSDATPAVPSGSLWTSEMVAVACRVAQLCLRVTSRRENMQGVLHIWRLYENAGWLQRGGVASFLLPRSALVSGNLLLSHTFCVCTWGLCCQHAKSVS